MIIYEIKNLINGKKYIGKDSKNNPNYLGSGKYLKLAIKKYGRKNFKKIILEICSTLEELNNREVYWLQALGCKDDPMYYNATDTITPCRAGTPLSDEHKRKISQAHKGKKMPPRTESAIRKQVQSRIANGTNLHSDETRAKMSKASLGKSKSAEHRASMSACRLGVKTQPCSEEKKRRISEKQRKRPISQIDKDTGELIRSYDSISKAVKDGYNPNALQNALKGISKTSGGFIWRYV